MLRSIGQVLQVTFKFEAYTRTSTHAPPAIKKNPRNNQKANDNQPFTQTKFHEYSVPVCYAVTVGQRAGERCRNLPADMSFPHVLSMRDSTTPAGIFAPGDLRLRQRCRLFNIDCDKP